MCGQFPLGMGAEVPPGWAAEPLLPPVALGVPVLEVELVLWELVVP
jgi:hypothetical protein